MTAGKTTMRDVRTGRFTTRPMHRLRKLGMREKCPVCGAERFMRCIQVKPQVGAKEYAEFKLLAAVHDLREVAPDHILVQAIEMVLESADVSPDQLSLFASVPDKRRDKGA